MPLEIYFWFLSKFKYVTTNAYEVYFVISQGLDLNKTEAEFI